MYGEAMKRILNRLKSDHQVPISECRAVDFFARDGGWQTVAFANEVSEISAWEIDSQFLPQLQANLPQNAEITIGDSYDIALLPENRHRFDFIVLDNPQGIFGDGKCEHFEALPLVSTLAADQAVVVFNVNIKPFNYDQHPDWAARRAMYYESDASQLSVDFIIDFYGHKFAQLGFEVRNIFTENRAPANYLYSLVASLRNKDHE